MKLKKHFKILALILGAGCVLSGCVRGDAANSSQWQVVKSVPKVSVLSEAIENHQVMYVGTNGKGVYVSKDAGAHWRSLGLLGQAVTNLQVSTQGKLFAVTNFGLYQYDHGKWLILYLGQNSNIGKPSSIALWGNKIFAAGMLHGVYQFSGAQQKWIKVGDSSWPNQAVASQLAIDSQGRIFAGTMERGIFKYDQQTWQAFNQGFDTSFLWAINAFAFGAHNQLYVGTSRAVLMYNEGRWQQLGAGSWPLTAAPRSLYVDASNNVYAALSTGGLYEYDAEAKVWRAVDTRVLPSQQIYFVGEFKGVLYIGTNAGLFVYRP